MATAIVPLPVEIQAARLRLVKDRPYLAAAAWALQPVAKPGMGTMAVDMWWRLYFDPAVITAWSVEQITAVLYHEIQHLLRDHAARMENFEPRLANIAADAEINDDILREGVVLPGEPVTPATIGQPDNLLAEEYYAALEQTQTQGSAPRQGASAQPGQQQVAASTGAGQEGQQGDADGQGDTSADASAQNAASSTAHGGGQADNNSAQPGSRGDPSGSTAGDAGGSTAGGGDESNSSSSSSQPSASSAQPGASSQPPADPAGNRSAGGKNGEGKHGDETQTPAPGAGRCGSAANGHPEPWEDPAPGSGGEGTSHGIGRAEAELIRRQVAEQIREHARSRGDVPVHLARWAEEKLSPRVDWRRELAAVVRRAVADVAGANDYSYRRPSRRQGQVGNGSVILPSLRRPVPQVAVVVDTSGSVSDEMLARALAEVSGVLKASGQREGVHVLSVDAAVQSCRRVFRPEQVELRGGGGTDMTVGIEAAMQLRPRPDVVIVITDGYTDWPTAKPQAEVIVVLTDDSQSAPAWARKVVIR